MENRIHPTAWLDPETVLGKNNYIGPNCYIGPGVTIGDNNTFSGFCSIGMPAEHREYFKHIGQVVIGNHNMIREFTTINSSTKGVTRMGHWCVMLRGSHLSHDSVLEDMVNVSCNALIGGESTIMEGANLGMGCVIHQRQVIGSYSMIGMGAVVTRTADIVPGYIWMGNPAKMGRVNTVGLKRNNIDDDTLRMEIARYGRIKRGAK